MGYARAFLKFAEPGLNMSDLPSVNLEIVVERAFEKPRFGSVRGLGQPIELFGFVGRDSEGD